jgi:hypothetical protein
MRAHLAGRFRAPVPIAVVAFALVAASPVRAHVSTRLNGAPAAPRNAIVDLERRHDRANMDLVVTNIGSLGFDLVTGNGGLRFPVGEPTTALFAAGLWVGAKVNGETRVTVAEYSSEWGPGRIVGGVHENPDGAALKTYKVFTTRSPDFNLAYPETAYAEQPDPNLDPLFHHSWSEYVSLAGPLGAPVGTVRMPNTDTPAPDDSIDVPGPDLPGHIALWSVFNDADPFLHTNDAGASAPLGLEVQQTVFSRLFDDAVYVRWQITNEGTNTLEETYIGFWSDPDLGGAGDDLVGWDAANQMGYCYNATSNDLQYGANPPAVALLMVEGPYDPATQTRKGVYSFNKYIGGTDPNSPQQSYWGLQGLETHTGNPFIDPTTNQPTRYVVPGDPLTGTGWIDTNAADRRMMLSLGPITLAPGESTDLVVAFLVQQGNNRLDSVKRLRCYAPAVRDRYLAGMPDLPPAVECPVETQCPQLASFYANICDQPQDYPPSTLQFITVCASNSSVSYFNAGQDFCTLIDATTSARDRAMREYLTLLGNVCLSGSALGVVGPGGNPVGIRGDAPVSCPPLTATTVNELAQPASSLQMFIAADYLNVVDPGLPRGFEPVDFGLTGFGGGADAAYNFLGSSLDPTTQPDSFPRVEIVFDPSQPQYAHRYLRLQQADGSAPSTGREYRFGGLWQVPFRVLDTSTGQQLQIAFTERTVTDANGTILSPFEQFASFDSAWAPTDEFDGGREYLLVFSSPYTGTEVPELAVNGAPQDFGLPWLYALAARSEAGRVVDPGDGFYWERGHATSPGVDQYLLDLAAQPQDDPDVIAAYEELAECLFQINAGKTLGIECDATVPALLYFEGSEVGDDGAVRVTWHAGDRQMGALELERRRDGAEWTALGLVLPDGQGRILYVDGDTRPGDRLSYRLLDPRTHEPVAGGTAEVIVPGGSSDNEATLELAGVVPDGDGVLVRFRLPAAGEARLAMYNALGRRVATLELGRLEAGTYTKRLGAGSLTSGLYFARLEFAGEQRVAKALVVRR